MRNARCCLFFRIDKKFSRPWRDFVSLLIVYPARIPHPGQPGLGNVPGYFHPHLAALGVMLWMYKAGHDQSKYH
ncbi:MAG TPA: hypothetical protein VGJ30_07745 [Candidatus Angelobacter sp.]|jgi:hypothetical protein